MMVVLSILNQAEEITINLQTIIDKMIIFIKIIVIMAGVTIPEAILKIDLGMVGGNFYF